MTVSIDSYSMELPSPEVMAAKFALNTEFMEKARIIGAVGILYFPSELSVGMEIEGTCYFSKDPMGQHSTSYDRKLLARRKGINCDIPIIRLGISITPNELKRIKPPEISVSCMKGVINTIQQASKKTVVPFPLSFSPLLSTSYLCISNAFGNNKVTKIDIEYGSPSNIKKAFGWAVFGAGLELGLVVSGCSWLALKTFLLLK